MRVPPPLRPAAAPTPPYVPARPGRAGLCAVRLWAKMAFGPNPRSDQIWPGAIPLARIRWAERLFWPREPEKPIFI
ncbi:hypothetical protein PR202_ga15916 [Eleusine coracana subsp. coracana]|uniref:Uncharacterized protein n=1 Tax=Eleusine coracana subsp. coracana TaxID=191504 RepID=A0AAV5CLG4_ELECO|nr:hypothetical protein PR202_ga15916 [Eleusine coracana subsp. coracana]